MDQNDHATCVIYYRPLEQWLEVTPEAKQTWDRSIDTTIKHQQRAGLCCVPRKKHYLCDGHCEECEYACNTTGVIALSIDDAIDHAYQHGISPHSILSHPSMVSSIDVDLIILRQIIVDLYHDEPENYQIICCELAEFSERDAAELLHLSRKAYVHRRNKLFRRIKEFFDF